MKKNHTPSKVKKGFTLTELLVVIAILAVLSTITVIGYTHFIKKAAISSDTQLINQVNTILKVHRIYEDVDDDNSIAKVLQDNLEDEVEIQSKKYHMDIYYNDNIGKFELLTIANATESNYKTLSYYLNLSVLDDSTNNNTSSTPNSNIYFNINEEYHKNFGQKNDFHSSEPQNLEAYIENGILKVMIFIDESKDVTSNPIDLSEIITATDSFNNKLDVKFECFEIALIEHIAHSPTPNYILKDNMLTINTPGQYQIKYSCHDQEGTLNLYVKNVYWSRDAEITVNNDEINYIPTVENNSDGTSKIQLTISEYMDNILVKDYEYSTHQFYDDPKELTYIKEVISSYGVEIPMYILLEINGHIIEKQITNEFCIFTFDSIYLSIDNTVSITYKYIGYNGYNGISDSYTTEITISTN